LYIIERIPLLKKTWNNGEAWTKEAAPPIWKRRPISLVCSYRYPLFSEELKEKSEATGWVANPGAIATRCENSYRLGWRSALSRQTNERLTDGLKVGAEANNQGHVDKESTSLAKHEPYGMLQSLNQSIISD
jgi:hypothetical protein